VQQGIVLPAGLIPPKIADHQRERSEFKSQLQHRVASIRTDSTMQQEFLREMQRFLPVAVVRDTLSQPAWWSYLTSVLADQARLALAVL
jgi:hypothetical protein